MTNNFTRHKKSSVYKINAAPVAAIEWIRTSHCQSGSVRGVVVWLLSDDQEIVSYDYDVFHSSSNMQ